MVKPKLKIANDNKSPLNLFSQSDVRDMELDASYADRGIIFSDTLANRYNPSPVAMIISPWITMKITRINPPKPPNNPTPVTRNPG